MKKQGLVLSCVGGAYTVETDDGVYTCRARGAFRKEGVTPLAGDHVTVSAQDADSGVLEEILPRRNCLVRPPVANLDCLVLVAATADPAPNTLVMDKMIAIAELNDICPIIVINKSDLEDASPWRDIYEKSGFEVFVVSANQPDSVAPLCRRLAGQVSVFTGNSGVGKSSLLNVIEPRLSLQTGEISRSLGRGRHTTRATTLFRLESGGYLVDTPGVSSLELERTQRIRKEQLPFCFRELEPYFGRCRFTSCVHVKEAGCAVRAAVEAGDIARSRYESYTAIYAEIKDFKDWE